MNTRNPNVNPLFAQMLTDFSRHVVAPAPAEIREQAEEWADEQEQDERDAKALDGVQL